ncbi:MAG: adenine deaminase C-terminal domain-containing protein [Oscillospiraceae bacterium]
MFVPLGVQFEKRLAAVRPVLQRCVMGLEPCDWLIKGGRVANVLTGETYPAHVWIKDGFIVHVEDEFGAQDQTAWQAEMHAHNTYDATGMLLLPGFVDTHVHVESTMLSPYQLGKLLAATGTTTILADPHEIVNVAGEEGFKYMLSDSKNSPVRQFYLVPSCVPAVPGIENAGADWDASVTSAMLDINDSRIAGLAEVMDYQGVIHRGQRMASIVDNAVQKGAFVQGHCFQTFGRSLSSYILAGCESNHENLSGKEMHASLRNGIQVNIRLTSSLASSDYSEMLDGCKKSGYFDGISTCTDDVHVRDLIKKGHLNATVGVLIDLGIKPMDAVRMASLNGWREYGVKCAGAIAPGHIADIQLMQAGRNIGEKPYTVFVDGKQVLEAGCLVQTPSRHAESAVFEQKNMVNRAPVTEEDLRVKAKHANSTQTTVRTMDYPAGSTLNVENTATVPVKDGYISIENEKDLCWVMVFNRYGLQNRGVGVLQNYNLKQGAIASTISHDSHNLTVAFRDRAAAVCAINLLIKNGGGVAYANAKLETAVLSLPIGGLMSSEEPEKIAAEVEEIEKLYHQNNGEEAHMMGIAILALPVVPSLRITDMGIADVLKQKILPLELE